MNNPGETIDLLGCYAAAVHGCSMYPLLHDRRDVVYLEKREPLKKYDTVLFQRDNGQFVLHRILKIDGDTLNMCGDKEFSMERIRRDQVLAVMIEFTRNGKSCSCDNIWYKFYVHFWCLSFPTRRILRYGYRTCEILLQKLTVKKHN